MCTGGNISITFDIFLCTKNYFRFSQLCENSLLHFVSVKSAAWWTITRAWYLSSDWTTKTSPRWNCYKILNEPPTQPTCSERDNREQRRINVSSTYVKFCSHHRRPVLAWQNDLGNEKCYLAFFLSVRCCIYGHANENNKSNSKEGE